MRARSLRLRGARYRRRPGAAGTVRRGALGNPLCGFGYVSRGLDDGYAQDGPGIGLGPVLDHDALGLNQSRLLESRLLESRLLESRLLESRLLALHVQACSIQLGQPGGARF